MPEDAQRRPYSLQQLVTQLLLAAVYVREGEVIERERGGVAPPELVEARRRKLDFIALLTEEERRDVRASFRPLLCDIPGTDALPFSPAVAPRLYPVSEPVSLVYVGGSRRRARRARRDFAA